MPHYLTYDESDIMLARIPDAETQNDMIYITENQAKAIKSKPSYKLDHLSDEIKYDVARAIRIGKPPKDEDAAEAYYSIIEKPSPPASEISFDSGALIPAFGTNMNTNRVAYIWAPSGAGKTYQARRLVDEWRRNNKKGDIYIFSRFNADTDDALKIKNAKFISEKDMISQMRESGTSLKVADLVEAHPILLVFDDFSAWDKLPYECAAQTLKDAIENGRKARCSVIVTSHQACDNKRPILRDVWNESHLVIIFPAACSGRSAKYPMESYIGLDKKQINKMLAIPTRSLCIRKVFPQAVIAEKIAYLL